MTVNQKIEEALKDIGCPVELDLYEGDENVSITYHEESEQTYLFGDQRPQETVYEMQIHLCVPPGYNYFEIKDKIKWRLLETGFSWPEVELLMDEEYRFRLIVFKCQISIPEERKV